MGMRVEKKDNLYSIHTTGGVEETIFELVVEGFNFVVEHSKSADIKAALQMTAKHEEHSANFVALLLSDFITDMVDSFNSRYVLTTNLECMLFKDRPLTRERNKIMWKAFRKKVFKEKNLIIKEVTLRKNGTLYVSTVQVEVE